MKHTIFSLMLNIAALLLVSHTHAQSEPATITIDNGYTNNYTYAYGSTDTTPKTKLTPQEIIDKIREIVEKI